MNKADMTLGFAGIGLMGLPMCRRLLAAGYPLTVWNRNRDKCAPLQAEGAAVVATPAELAQHCDVLILCLADTSAVCEVTEAVLPALQKGQIIIDCSSIEPQATRELAARVVQHGAILFPVRNLPLSFLYHKKSSRHFNGCRKSSAYRSEIPRTTNCVCLTGLPVLLRM